MQIITATIPQYANGNFFIQAAGSNISEIAGSISTFGTFAAPVLPNIAYGITILPPQGTSYSRFGTTFVSGTDAMLDISDILAVAIPPPVSLGIELKTNGIDNTLQTELNLIDGTNVTMTVDDDGGVTINSSGGGSGSVTHTLGPLTAGSVVIGNGGGDIKVAPIDYGVTTANTTTISSSLVVNDIGGTNGTMSMNNDSAGGSAFIVYATAGSGNEWIMQATGTSATPFRGFIFEDATHGNITLLLSSNDSSHGIVSTLFQGIFGWYAGASPVSTAIDTGLSRKAPAIVAIGNGTQGDASGQAQFATHLGPAVAPTGSGPAGAWSFSQDGKISFCNAGTWEQIVP